MRATRRKPPEFQMQNNPFRKPATFASVLRFLSWIVLSDPIIIGGYLLVLVGLVLYAKH